MRFYTLLINNEEKVAVSADGGNTIYTMESLIYDFKDMNELIMGMNDEMMDELKKNLAVIAEGERQAMAQPVKEYRMLAPIVRPRQDVICLGINYAAHAIESGKFHNEAFGGDRPYTIYFSKRVNRAVGPEEPIQGHFDIVDSLDYEVELGVVLKDDTYGVNAEEAMDHIFGYTIINDISARNLQTRHKQWYLGKSLDGFTPIGPCIVTPDEIGDAENLAITSRINGELRQNSNTSLMIQTVGGAIADLAAGMTLQAGTLIATGTPAGVAMGMEPPQFLKAGDVVTCEIEGIGVLENVVF
ncbi:MAG: fumarylacetoacetate hydrolase family protein [Clostridiales bacterium]|nr:fumarylacetoacetate hydrolase family protein [Candidatus Crickella merdequi]